MANGARAAAALEGGAAGAAAGPIGAGVGAAAGYLAASLGSIFGGHKKPPPPKPWYVQHAIALSVGGGVAVIGFLGVIIWLKRR